MLAFVQQPRVILLAALAVGAWQAAACAESDLPVPADLLEAHAYPGVQAVLELDGRNVHNVGNIWLHVTNFGLIGSQPGSPQPWSGAPSAQWPGGAATEYLWAAGLWIGALRAGEPHVTTGQFEAEFRPGRSDLDRMYRAHDLEPGGARAPAANADDDHDGRTDEDWLDGRDNDRDGRIDEDFAAISNQMFVCEYSDADPKIQLVYPEHEPLGLVVRQTSMAWEGEAARNFIAFDFTLVNTGYAPLEDVYVGLFADGDIGPRAERSPASDDMAGFWEGNVQTFVGRTATRVPVSLGYMWDEDTDGGQSEGYIGLAFLGGLAMHNFRWFAGRAAFSKGGDPTNDAERYQVLDGSANFSLDEVDPVTGFRTARATRFSTDYRMLASARPAAVISPGDTVSFQVALVIGRFLEGLQDAAAQAQITWQGGWADCDNNATTGVDGREESHCGPEEVNERYPIRGPGDWGKNTMLCDSTCILPQDLYNPRCFVSVPLEGCIWIDGDCDPTTGVDGKECIVRWLVGLPPPSPRMRLLPSEGRVDVLFDNRSETSLDPNLKVTDFESYRIWRADGWQRPLGSSRETGPGADLWMLMAEFDLPRNGIGPDVGLEAIRHQPNLPEPVIAYYREWFRVHPLLQPPVLPGFTRGQLDTAQALARGVRYYRWTDPQFTAPPSPDDPPCVDGRCTRLLTESGLVNRRCDERGRCRPTTAPPHPGVPYFYSVTATDHLLQLRDGQLVASAAGMQGDPQGNFAYVEPASPALPPEQARRPEQQIYVVPNPATRQSMAPWTLQPTNDDPSGLKIEFRNLPAAAGTITILTLAGDRVAAVAFDGRSGSGTAKWNLVNRNGQPVTSGVYLYVVETADPRFAPVRGRFVVVL